MLSALCLVHCLLLPLLLAAAPALSLLADESVHRLLLLLLGPPLVFAMVRGQVLHRRRGAAVLLLVGFALLLAGGFSGNESLELPLTVLGSLVLITGHGLNAWWCRRCPLCASKPEPGPAGSERAHSQGPL